MLDKVFRIGILVCCIIITVAFVFQAVNSQYQLHSFDLRRIESELSDIASELRDIDSDLSYIGSMLR
jgi:hypothetical protein